MFLDSVRQFKKNDFPKFAEFIKKQFHEKYILSDEKFFNWQYRDNPYLDDYAFFLLKQDKAIYGYIGMVPLKYKCGNGKYKMNVYCNLFVDERARGLGLGTLLIKRAMKEEGPAMIVGYNPKSFSTYQKLGDWGDLGNYYRYVHIFNQDAVLSMMPNKSFKNDSYVQPVEVSTDSTIAYEPIKTFDSEFDLFWANTRNRYSITVERTSQYMNWRYANHPSLKYEIRVLKKENKIVGCIVYRIEKTNNFSIARIIDFISDEKSEKTILENTIKELSTQVDMVDFMFSGKYYHETLKNLGFFDVYGTDFENLPIYFNPVLRTKNYINFIVWQNGIPIDENAFYNHNNWYLTKGDSDQDRPNPH